MDRCKLTLAGGVIEPKVSFLPLARLSAPGHNRTPANDGYQALRELAVNYADGYRSSRVTLY